MDCDICKLSFTVSRIPMVINCGHSFCNNCATKMKKCPLDKTDITKIVKNFQYIHLLETHVSYIYPRIYKSNIF